MNAPSKACDARSSSGNSWGPPGTSWRGTAVVIGCVALGSLLACGTDGPNAMPTDGGAVIDAGPRDGSGDGSTDDPFACTSGVVPTDLSPSEDAPKSLVADDAYVYWLNSGGGTFTLRRAPKRRDRPAETLLETKEVIASMAQTGGRLVLVAGGKSGEVFTFDPTTKERTKLAKAPAGIELDAFGVAADASFAYVIGHETAAVAEVLLRVPLTGGTFETLARIELPVDQDVKAARVDGTHVYWGIASGYIMRAAKAAAGVVETIVDDEGGVSAFDLGANDLFYIASTEHSAIVRVPKSGGAPVTIIEHTGARFAIAVSDRDVVYATASDIVHRIDPDGSNDRAITASGVVSCGSLLPQGDRIFFANTATIAAGGSVRSTCVVR